MEILNFVITNIQYIISGFVSACFFVVNIILAIKNKSKRKLKEALLYLPQVISNIEILSRKTPLNSIEKKAMAEVLLKERYGKLYIKNSEMFDDAIEDILKTPQKKGGSSDVS